MPALCCLAYDVLVRNALVRDVLTCRVTFCRTLELDFFIEAELERLVALAGEIQTFIL